MKRDGLVLMGLERGVSKANGKGLVQTIKLNQRVTQ